MKFVIAVSMPAAPANYGPLTLEELQELEGRQRQHIEARLNALTNIDTLVHAAMVQVVYRSLGQIYCQLLTLHCV